MPRFLQGGRSRGALFWCALWTAAIVLVGCATQSRAGSPREIHSVQQLRRLSLEDLRAQVTVRLRGYITVSDPVWNVTILEDEAGGGGVRLDADDFSLPTNQLVEVTGFAAAAGDNPTVAKPRVRWLAAQGPPEAKPVKLEQLFDPARQYTQVQVQGIVRDTVADRNDRIVGVDGSTQYRCSAPCN